jgi:general secretion pathway protein J
VNRLRSRNGRGQRGFTLLELLVAVGILGIVMSTVYGVLTRTLMATKRAEARAELFASGREMVMRMADEIEGALPPDRRVYFVGEHGEATPPNDAIGFYTIINRMLGAERRVGGLAFVTYSLDKTDDGLFALRRVEELLANEGSAEGDPNAPEDTFDPSRNDEAATDSSEPVISAVHLLDRIAGLRFGYIDPENGELVDQWDTSQPGPDNRLRNLPAAVSITLFLADEYGGIHDFGTIVDLPLAPYPTPGAR